ncbi:MAG: RsmG family class I SAM-dependent methyltransferase [Acidimicrobiales bacterium]
MTGSHKTLHDVLGDAQKWGTLGRRPISEVIEHARQFLPPLEGCAGDVIDLGTGAGVPGLVIADARPDLRLVLVDRRATRIDALRRAVASMALEDRVEAITTEVESLTRDPEHAGRYAAVVSRGFGPPEVTLRLARALAKNGGTIVISEPPAGTPSRWPEELLSELSLEAELGHPGVAVFHVKQG